MIQVRLLCSVLRTLNHQQLPTTTRSIHNHYILIFWKLLAKFIHSFFLMRQKKTTFICTFFLLQYRPHDFLKSSSFVLSLKFMHMNACVEYKTLKASSLLGITSCGLREIEIATSVEGVIWAVGSCYQWKTVVPPKQFLKFLPLKYLKMTSLLTVFNKFKPFVEEFPLRIVHWKGKKTSTK